MSHFLIHPHSHSHSPSSGAEAVHFKAEINVDVGEITRMYLSKMNQSTAQVERLLLEHGERVVDRLGAEIDRVEIKIKVGVGQGWGGVT